MTRKLLLLAVTMLLALTCAPSPGPVHISGYFPVDMSAGCVSTSGEVLLQSGFLNVAGNPSYMVTAEVKGVETLITPEVAVGGQQIEPADRDRLRLDRVLLSYASTLPGLGLPAREEVSLLTSLEGDPTYLVLNLLGPQASQALGDAARPGGALIESNLPEDGTVLTVTTELQGHSIKTNTPFTTGPAPFRIRVVNTPDPACPAKEYVRETGCKTTGQDSVARTSCCGGTLSDGGVASTFGCP